MTSIEERIAIEDLFSVYGFYLDDDRLEDWLELFVEDCTYKIMPRENVDLDLPASLMLCENKNMLRDRIVSLREANEYSIHRDKHLISNLRIEKAAHSNFIVAANFLIFQSDSEGAGSLFSFGTYNDKIIFVNDEPKFLNKTVIIDNWSIPHMLSTPL